MQLIGAVDFNKVDGIKNLIAEGVDINYVADETDEVFYGRSPLLHCIRTAGISQFDVDFEVFELLLANGATLEGTDEEGNSAILVAVKYFALQLLGSLIQQGATIHAQNEEGQNAFDIIVARYEEEQQLDVDHLDTIQDAERREDVQQGVGEAFERMLDRIDAIVKHGYDLNAGDESAAFVAVTAISEDRLPLDVLSYLFEQGADVREHKNGPLVAYAMFRQLPNDTILSMMQMIGLEYVFERYHNFTAVNFAVARNNVDLTRQLITLGADIHMNAGQPLRNACKLGYLEIAKCLVEAGADINIVDEKGNTPLYYAQAKGVDALVDWLKSQGAK